MAQVGLSGAVKDPKLIAESPFPQPLEHRLSRDLPSWSDVYWQYRRCAQRSTSTSIMGFGDSTGVHCGQGLLRAVKAKWFGDQDAVDVIYRSRRQLVDAWKPPWQPRPEYLSLLEQQQRLMFEEPPAASVRSKSAQRGAAPGAPT